MKDNKQKGNECKHSIKQDNQKEIKNEGKRDL